MPGKHFSNLDEWVHPNSAKAGDACEHGESSIVYSAEESCDIRERHVNVLMPPHWVAYAGIEQSAGTVRSTPAARAGVWIPHGLSSLNHARECRG